MDSYDELPVDVADASRVWLSHPLGTVWIAIMDRTDFSVHRDSRGRALKNLFFG